MLPPPTGIGSGGGTPIPTTSVAVLRAPLSSDWVSDRCCSTTITTAPAQRPTARTSAASTVSRSRNPRPRQAVVVVIALPAVEGQPIAGTAHGLHRLSAVRCVDLAPQITHVNLDHVGIAVVVGIPDVLEDLGLGYDVAGPAQ